MFGRLELARSLMQVVEYGRTAGGGVGGGAIIGGGAGAGGARRGRVGDGDSVELVQLEFVELSIEAAKLAWDDVSGSYLRAFAIFSPFRHNALCPPQQQ